MIRIIVSAVATAALASVYLFRKRQTKKKPKTVDHVDLERYLGLWYEQAAFPNFFQRKC